MNFKVFSPEIGILRLAWHSTIILDPGSFYISSLPFLMCGYQSFPRVQDCCQNSGSHTRHEGGSEEEQKGSRPATCYPFKVLSRCVPPQILPVLYWLDLNQIDTRLAEKYSLFDSVLFSPA